MKNKSVIKRCVLIFASAAVLIYGIILGYVYGFWGHFTKMNDKDFRTVYEIVCKNTDIYFYHIRSIKVNDEVITVVLKLNYVPYLFTESDSDAVNFYTAFNTYTELQDRFKNKKIYVSTGAIGSSYSACEIDEGQLYFDRQCSPDNVCELSFDEILEQVCLADNIYKISYGWDATTYEFNSVTKQLPTNHSVKSLEGFSVYEHNFSEIKSFQGLETIDLSFINDSKDNVVDLDFVNDLINLESLIIHADSMRIDIADVRHNKLKKFTLHTNSCSQELEKQLADAFPNAEISIVCDY